MTTKQAGIEAQERFGCNPELIQNMLDFFKDNINANPILLNVMQNGTPEDRQQLVYEGMMAYKAHTERLINAFLRERDGV